MLPSELYIGPAPLLLLRLLLLRLLLLLVVVSHAQ
jgi:hypothetical protein